MGDNKIERDLMSQEEFEEYIMSNSGLKTFIGVSKFKSTNRAIRRGHMVKNGMIIPRKPFNNRANTSKRQGVDSRSTNSLKKSIYGELLKYRQ